ncbi:YhgE/Pip domain-containing protein [Streptomyces syringium]|uniref:YhgE/Pip domain-containing protein n=1 Tax=Streptomyces syringium TaxID=76729 RepID=UPI003D8F49C3
MPSPQPSSALRSPRLWIGSGLILAVVSTLFALLYVGGNVDPKGNLRDLPVALVNSDRGADAGGKHTNLGDQIVSGIEKKAADNRSIEWQVLSRQEADKRLGQGKVFGALVVPKDFTATVTGLTNPKQKQATRPALTVLTNQSAGSIGSSMASQAAQKAAHAASAQIGKDLLDRAKSQGAKLAPAAQLMLADPATVEVADGHPVGSHSAMGLSAFYYALVLVVCGMLGANAISSQVDTALGYVHTDFGPFRQRMPVQHTSRVRTLAIGTVLMLGLSVVMGSLVQAATVGILDMDASHLGLLWLYSVGTIAVVGVSALALLSVFGTPGMLLSAIIFVAMAVPSSGATVPLQALPDFFRALAAFEPLRQITGGLRSILYYDAQADAGLTRAWISMGIALVVSVLFGFGVTRFYDRKGMHRIPRPAEASDSTESAESTEGDEAAENTPAPATA